MTTAILVQAHKECRYIKKIAELNPNVNFYIHFDYKSKVDINSYVGNNIVILSNRINVRWGGISQVHATINLFKEALNNNENNIFHLISGEDLFLKSFEEISSEITQNKPEIYMDFRYSIKHRYRIRFRAIHSDTVWQRTVIGKILTKINVLLDKIIPISKSHSKLVSVYGSQWFSFNRFGLEKMLNALSDEDLSFFRKKLCPDEHIFQYIIEKNNLHSYLVKNNKRYIDLAENKNHPRYIELPELKQLSKSSYWITRKVRPDTAVEFIRSKL